MVYAPGRKLRGARLWQEHIREGTGILANPEGGFKIIKPGDVPGYIPINGSSPAYERAVHRQLLSDDNVYVNRDLKALVHTRDQRSFRDPWADQHRLVLKYGVPVYIEVDGGYVARVPGGESAKNSRIAFVENRETVKSSDDRRRSVLQNLADQYNQPVTRDAVNRKGRVTKTGDAKPEPREDKTIATDNIAEDPRMFKLSDAESKFIAIYRSHRQCPERTQSPAGALRPQSPQMSQRPTAEVAKVSDLLSAAGENSFESLTALRPGTPVLIRESETQHVVLRPFEDSLHIIGIADSRISDIARVSKVGQNGDMVITNLMMSPPRSYRLLGETEPKTFKTPKNSDDPMNVSVSPARNKPLVDPHRECESLITTVRRLQTIRGADDSSVQAAKGLENRVSDICNARFINTHQDDLNAALAQQLQNVLGISINLRPPSEQQRP